MIPYLLTVCQLVHTLARQSMLAQQQLSCISQKVEVLIQNSMLINGDKFSFLADFLVNRILQVKTAASESNGLRLVQWSCYRNCYYSYVNVTHKQTNKNGTSTLENLEKNWLFILLLIDLTA